MKIRPVLCILTALAMLFALAACGAKAEEQKAPEAAETEVKAPELSELEVYLNQIVSEPDTFYMISTTDHGPRDPKGTDPAPFIEKLLTGVRYESADISETPDGEYAVISFPATGDRFMFYFLEGSENYIRQLRADGSSMLFKAVFEDPSLKASAVVNEWYRAIAEQTGGTDSYTPDDLIGTWAEKDAGRCYIEITPAAEGEYKVHIHWSSSAFESSNWDMTAVPTGNGGQLRYENARCYIRTFTSVTDFTDTVEYENGTGTLTLNSVFEIMWDDETAHAGDNCVFIYAN